MCRLEENPAIYCKAVPFFILITNFTSNNIKWKEKPTIFLQFQYPEMYF